MNEFLAGPEAAGIIYRSDDGCILLLQRGNAGDYPGTWAFPGGHIEYGESAMHAAIREFHEETGYLVKDCQPIGVNGVFAYFYATGPKFDVTLSEESTAHIWVNEADTVYADDGTFNEADHPRAADGKFGNGGGSSAPSKEKTKKSGGASQGFISAKSHSDLPPHIQALKLPPAWSDLKYNPDPKGNLQAIGKDAKGRPQYRYSEEFMTSNKAEKFQRILGLEKEFSTIQSQNDVLIKSGTPKQKDAAECLKVIMDMGIRPGGEGDTGADKQAYGATTLEGRHVVTEGSETYLRFVGKKGVDLNLKVTDKSIADMLRERSASAGPDGQVFGRISAAGLLEHTHSLGSGEYKTKDFRTRLATKKASDLVQSIPVPTSEKEHKAAVKRVAKQVSDILGNTPAIALDAYINPSVFDSWRL